MKIRIKGNSIRYRLNKTEVSIIATEGYLEETVQFPESEFKYALKRVHETDSLQVVYKSNCITMLVPESFCANWPVNNTVGINSIVTLPNGNKLSLLLEKDFACIDHTDEDQSDNYENPNRAC